MSSVATVETNQMASPQSPHEDSALSQLESPGVQSSLPSNNSSQVTSYPASNPPNKPVAAIDTPQTLSRLADTDTDSDQTDSSYVPSGITNLQSSAVRKVYLCLAAHNGSVLDSFLQGVADPSEWEVYVWQAPEGPGKGDTARQFLQVAKQWQAEVSQFVSYTQAAGEVQC